MLSASPLLAVLLLAGWVAGAAVLAAESASAPRTIEKAEFVLDDRTTPPGDDAAWATVTLPHDWRTLEHKGRLTGWYRIRLDLDRVPAGGRSIYLRHLRSTSLDLYIDGKRYAGSRDIYGPGAQDYGFSLHLYVPAALWRPGSNILHFRMEASSYERSLHGLGRVHVGTYRQTSALQRSDNDLTGGSLRMSFAAALTAGLIALLLWCARRNDKVIFWFSIACLSWALASIPNFWLRPYTAQWILDITNMYVRFGMAVPAFVLALRLADRRLPRVEALLWAFLALEATYFVWAPALTPRLAEHWVARVFWPTASAMLLLLGVAAIARTVVRPLRWSHYVEMLALAAMGFFLLQDLARYTGFADLEPPIIRHYHVPILILAIGAAIFERHVAAIWRIERSNQELERRVAEKTREIERNHERMLIAEKEQALAAERQRILTDMHDGLGASLVGLLRQVQSGQAGAATIESRVREALQEMRIAIDALQPRDGDLGTVLGNLRYRLNEWIGASGIALAWEVEELPGLEDLPPSTVFALQRILLEAIANALKHSGARTLRIAARARDGQAVEIVVQDDGCGFDPMVSNGGLGLANMRARAARIGAGLEFVTRPGAGTAVWLVLPLRERSSGDGEVDALSMANARTPHEHGIDVDAGTG